MFSPKGSATGCDLLLGVSVILQRTSFRVHASSFRLLIVRICGNICAEALVVYRNSLLNRLTAV